MPSPPPKRSGPAYGKAAMIFQYSSSGNARRVSVRMFSVPIQSQVTLELQYKLLNKGRVEHLGIGRTLAISSGGVL